MTIQDGWSLIAKEVTYKDYQDQWYSGMDNLNDEGRDGYGGGFDEIRAIGGLIENLCQNPKSRR